MRRLAATVVAFACLLLPGCLEMEQTIVLEADGSGRQTLRMAVKDRVLGDLQKASAAAQLGGAPNVVAVFDKELVAGELTAAGLALQDHAAEHQDGRRTVALSASFPSFAALQKSPLCGTAAEWVRQPGPKPGTVKLTFYPQGQAAWQQARQRAAELQGDAIPQQFFQKRQQQLAGLDVTLRLQVPGEVLVWTRNLEKTGDREVVARITPERIRTPEDLVRWLAPRFEVIYRSDLPAAAAK